MATASPLPRARRDLGGVLSVLIWALVGLWGLICLSLSALAAGLGGLWWDRDRRVFHAINRLWGAGLTHLLPMRVEVRGVERLGAGPYVIAPNHQSVVDLLVLYRLPVGYRTVVKRSWLRSPLGLGIRLAGYVPTERSADRAGAEEVLGACARWLQRGISVLMFPEGTRSRQWRLRRFKRGPFALAVGEGAPVLPVAVAGSNDLSHPDSWRFDPFQRVILEILSPIAPGDDVGRLRAETRARLEERVAVLRRELRDRHGQGPSAPESTIST